MDASTRHPSFSTHQEEHTMRTTYCNSCGKFTTVIMQYFMCSDCLEKWYATPHNH